MRSKSATIVAITGSTLFALLLTGSQRTAATLRFESNPAASAEIRRLNSQGRTLLAEGRYGEAREAFLRAAGRARAAEDARAAAMNLSNAGFCSITLMQFRMALDEFSQARTIAETAAAYAPLINTLNNLASLYIHMGEPDNAIRVAQEALSGPAKDAVPNTHAKLLFQLAVANMELNKFDDASRSYRQAIRELMDQDDLAGAALAWGSFGNDSLAAGRLDDAELALSEALRLVRVHHINSSGNILSGLAQLKSRQGDVRSSEALFEAALSAPPGLTPRWGIYSDRGHSRLNTGNIEGALADFRESRAIAARMRADIVPADQDRVSLEGGLSQVMEGLVDAGNRVFRQNRNAAVLQETFDAAEQDRLWSLRALVPSPNDWRSRLPDHYWEVLARYQTLEATSLAKPTPELEKNVERLRAELQRIEAAASGEAASGGEAELAPAESPLRHVRDVLDEDSVLLSFHVSKTSSWLWAVDRTGADVYPLPGTSKLRDQVSAFARGVKEGTAAAQAGGEIYKELFGAVPESYLKRKRWLLELDGPLYELPFAALVAGQGAAGPVYLAERAALQSIPSALMLEKGAIPGDGAFLGVGDPVYNTADVRYQGVRGKSDLMLARLPNTAQELRACSRAWHGSESRLLTGTDARPEELHTALRKNPAIIHFATHVVAAPGDFRSGLIALSLDRRGAMGLLGPKEIVARPVTASLVVMDGCHSAQGEALPSSGLMGLTRAWIGAGAKAVIATQWDVPDDAAESLITDFYSVLKQFPDRGAAFALREAQLQELGKDRASPGKWAGYFLLSRDM